MKKNVIALFFALLLLLSLGSAAWAQAEQPISTPLNVVPAGAPDSDSGNTGGGGLGGDSQSTGGSYTPSAPQSSLVKYSSRFEGWLRGIFLPWLTGVCWPWLTANWVWLAAGLGAYIVLSSILSASRRRRRKHRREAENEK